ncbi:hypothetical protein EIP91_005692 [Steccherinum ochraceum]|uniref:MYND-type domain-containing protein n=1 Tax=Steccherinum ochraceum TaxID=92696 RepID=A0A4R0R6W8_9APHY|nr:hypothetical protein EIP91_005692 [Steccherinum ochraceum]
MYYHATSIGQGGPGEPEEDARYRSLLLMRGGTLPPFPTLAVVREQIPILKQLFDEYQAKQHMPGPDGLPQPFVMLTKLQSLFLFSMVAVTNDIPKDVLDAVMAALKITVLLTEYDDLKPLLKMSGFCGALMDDVAIQRLGTIAKSRKVAIYLRDDASFTAEALHVLLQMIEQHKKDMISRRSPFVNAPWRDDVSLYAQLADVQVFDNKLNEDTQFLLEQLLAWAQNRNALDFERTKELRKDVVLSARIHLSLVCSQLEGPENAAKAKQHTKWVVDQFRPRRFMRDSLAGYVLRGDLPEHPVAVALGPEWFANAPSWRPPVHTAMPSGAGACEHCGKTTQKGESKLLKCARCQGVVYCSKDCQKAAWKQHKPTCKAA